MSSKFTVSNVLVAKARVVENMTESLFPACSDLLVIALPFSGLLVVTEPKNTILW